MQVFTTYRLVAVLVLALALACAFAFQAQPAAVNPLADAFQTGWMLADTNGDGIADFINGKVVVPANPSAAENAAAANLAARLGYGTTGLTPPLVVAAPAAGDGPRIWVGKDAVPASASGDLAALAGRLEKEEGGVFHVGGNLAVVGADDAGPAGRRRGLLGARALSMESAGRKDFRHRRGRPRELIGVTYLHGKQGIHRAILRSRDTISAETLNAALASARLASVHELIVMGGASATSSKPEAAQAPAAPANAAAAPANAAAAPAGGAAAATAAAPTRLDLATLYTSRGLFTGTPRMPLPSTLNGHLYVPAGAAGIAMANLAARMGLETTGIALPLATPIDRPPRATFAPRRCWRAIRPCRRKRRRSCAHRTPRRRKRKPRSLAERANCG